MTPHPCVVRESGIPRAAVYVTTKLAPGGFGTPFKGYDETMESFDRSNERLGLGYVDLYLLHHAFAREERLYQWRALVDLQKAGKVRSIGVSNWNIKHIEEIKAAGLPLPAVNQIEVHPLSTQSELVAYLKQHGIMPVAYSSLAPLPQWRADTPEKGATKDDTAAADATINGIATRLEVSAAQVLLRWGVQRGLPVLPKSTNEARIRANFDVFSFELSEDDMRSLDGLNQGKCFAWPTGDPLLCE